MAILLTDVLRLEHEGLVGFTETGEQVPLNAPVPCAILEERFPWPLENKGLFSRIMIAVGKGLLNRYHPGILKHIEIPEEGQKKDFEEMRDYEIKTAKYHGRNLKGEEVYVKLNDEVWNFNFATIQLYNLYTKRD